MEYLGQIIIFLSVLVSLRGKTWDGRLKGIRKITFEGLLTIGFAFTGLIISCMKVSDDAEQRIKDKEVIQATKKIQNDYNAF